MPIIQADTWLAADQMSKVQEAQVVDGGHPGDRFDDVYSAYRGKRCMPPVVRSRPRVRAALIPSSLSSSSCGISSKCLELQGHVMDTTEKTRENRLRRVAERRGLRLEKSRSRDPRAIGYGRYCLHQDRAGPRGLVKESASPIAETVTWVNRTAVPIMTLDEVEAWLER